MSSENQALCTRCGLCCDGTLFESVALQDDDGEEDARGLAALRKRHLPVTSTVDGHKLEHPCPALEGVLCGMYRERPTRCVSFACELLRNVEAGRREVPEALALIDRVRALVGRIPPRERTRWWSMHRRLAAQRDALDEEHRRQLDDLNRLRQLVTAHFLQR